MESSQEKIQWLDEKLREATVQDRILPVEERRRLFCRICSFQKFRRITAYAFDEIATEAAIQRAYQQLVCNPEKVLDWTDLLWPADSELFEKETLTKLLVGDPLRQLVISLPRGSSVQGDRVCAIITLKDQNTVAFVTRFGNVFTVRKPDFSIVSSLQIQKNVWVSGAAYLQRLNRALFLTGNTLEIGKLTGISNPGEKIFIGPFPATLTCVGLIDTSLRSKWLIAGKTSSDARKAVQVDVSAMDTIVFGDDKGWLHFLSINRKALVEAELVNKATILQTATQEDQTIADSNSQTPKRNYAPLNRQVYDERFNAKTIPPCNFKSLYFKRKVHDMEVLQVTYLPQYTVVCSCSQSSIHSLVITDNRDTQYASVPKGVRTLAFCSNVNLIATGGRDRLIRLWNPLLINRSIGALKGHLFAICALAYHESTRHLVSLSTSRTFRVWNVEFRECVQVIQDPTTSNCEQHIYSMAFDSTFEHLITGGAVIKIWELERPELGKNQAAKLDLFEPINYILPFCFPSAIQPRASKMGNAGTPSNIYDVLKPTICAIVSGGHRLTLYETSGGRIINSMVKSEAHLFPEKEKGAFISATALDSSLSPKLATGMSNGNIYIWDIGTGKNLPYGHLVEHSHVAACKCLEQTRTGGMEYAPKSQVALGTTVASINETVPGPCTLQSVLGMQFYKYMSKKFLLVIESNNKMKVWMVLNKPGLHRLLLVHLISLDEGEKELSKFACFTFSRFEELAQEETNTISSQTDGFLVCKMNGNAVFYPINDLHRDIRLSFRKSSHTLTNVAFVAQRTVDKRRQEKVTPVCEQTYLLCYSDGQVQLHQLLFEVDTGNLLDRTAIFSVKLSDLVFSNRRSNEEQAAAAFKVTVVKIAPQRPLIAEKIVFLACDGGRVYKLDLQYYLTAKNSIKAPKDTNTLMGCLRWRAHAGPINDLACFLRLNETNGKEELFLVTGGQDGLAKIFAGSTGVHLGILNQKDAIDFFVLPGTEPVTRDASLTDADIELPTVVFPSMPSLGTPWVGSKFRLHSVATEDHEHLKTIHSVTGELMEKNKPKYPSMTLKEVPELRYFQKHMQDFQNVRRQRRKACSGSRYSELQLHKVNKNLPRLQPLSGLFSGTEW